MSGTELFEIRRCRREDYAEFLDVLNEAFGHNAESLWFQQNIANCTPFPELVTDAEIANHVVAVERGQGRIVGGVGAYHFDTVVSEDAPDGEYFTLPTVGIGQVCCARDWRGRGVMTATLNRALADAAGAGAVLGALSGDRYRYGRFGFDFGGGALRMEFRYARLKTAIDTAGLKTRTATAADIDMLNALYERQASYVKRDGGYWRRLIDRRHRILSIGERNGRTAYIAYDAPYREIAEVCGDPDTAKALLLWHMERHDLDRAGLSLPLAPRRADPLASALLAVCSNTHARPGSLTLISIISPDTLCDILRPALDRAGAAGTASSAIARGELTKTELARCLLAAPGRPVPPALCGCAALRSLSLWFSDADGV